MKSWAFYRIIRALSWPLLSALFRLSHDGRDHVPADGALIVAANHVSYLDPAVLGAALPRPAHFIMVGGIWRKPGLNWFFRAMRSIPVDREGLMSRTALKAALEALSRGEVVGIFPEGGRALPDGSEPALAGVALLARRSGAPVLPAGISGTFEALPRGRAIPHPRRVRVCFGRPVRHEGGGREQDAAFTTILMREIRALMEAPASEVAAAPRGVA